MSEQFRLSIVEVCNYNRDLLRFFRMTCTLPCEVLIIIHIQTNLKT